MRNVGEELAQAREHRALSLTELSRRTKIKEAALRAIERNDTTKLPGGLYTRGFLRAYAREVGIDPEEIVARYQSCFDDQGAKGGEPLESLTASVNLQRAPDRLHAADVDALDRRRARARGIATVVLLLGGILYLMRAPDVRPALRLSDPGTIDAFQSRPVTEAAMPVVVGTGGSPDEPRSIEGESNGLQLGIRSRGLCWVTASADGRRVIYRLLNAGERIHIEALESVVLRVGDAASAELTVNGVAARRLGTAGQAVTVHLTRQNYRHVLSQ